MEEFFNNKGVELLRFITSHGVVWIYLFLFFSSILETFFPPYPSDLVTLMGGYLASSGILSLPFVYFFPSAGCLCGSLALYYIGKKGGRKLFQKDRGKILNKNQLNKIENWFGKYGIKVILASRFIPGVRSGIAVAAGLGKIELWKMAVFSLVSILAWNGIIISLAVLLQQNWQKVYKFLGLYNRLILVAAAVILIIWVFWLLKERSRKNFKGTEK